MSKFLQATNLTWSDSTATSVFQNCPVTHCEYVAVQTKTCDFDSNMSGRRGRDRIIIGFTTPCTIITYHQRCEFESLSWRGVLDTTLCIKQSFKKN